MSSPICDVVLIVLLNRHLANGVQSALMMVPRMEVLLFLKNMQQKTHASWWCIKLMVGFLMPVMREWLSLMPST